MSDDAVKSGIDGANVVRLPTAPYDDSVIEAINEQFALALVGSRAVILKENGSDAPVGERIQFLSEAAFKAWFANHPVNYNDRWTTYGELWLKSTQRRQFEGIEFVPDKDGAGGREGYYNLWNGFEVKPDKSGDCSLFIEHIEKVICNGDASLFQWVMAWFASLFQRPRERFGTSLVLRGAMGAGKTLVGRVIGSLIEPHYFLVDSPRYLTGQFNAHMEACLLLQADEGFWAGDKTAEGRLKSLITSDIQMIERKGVDPIRLPNYVRLMVTSNEDWSVPVHMRERRHAVIEVPETRAQDHDYFGKVMDQMNAPGGREALLWELLNWNLEPINVRAIPATDAMFSQMVRSFESFEGWLHQRLMDGEQLRGSGEWVDWVRTQYLHGDYVKHCETFNIKRPVDEFTFSKKLKEIMPALSRRRRSIKVRKSEEDGEYDEIRKWGYLFPELDEARAGFERAVGSPIDWAGGD